MDELEKLLGEEKETPTPSAEAPKEQPKVEETKDEEVLKKEEQLQNLNKAIKEANDQLRKTRKIAKTQPEEEDIPKIDFADPSAQAWDKHISQKVNPLTEETEREKEEVRTYALKQFLTDKPALASNPTKLKSLLDTYNNLKEGKISEKTTEGILLYLDKAYAAENYEELTRQSRERRIAQAQADAIYSDPAVSRGATAYSTEKESNPHLSEDDRAVLAKWGMSPAEWVALKKKHPN